MGDCQKALLPRPREGFCKFAGWVADFSRVEPDGDDAIFVGECLIEGRHGIFSIQLTQEAQNELRSQAETTLCIPQGLVDSLDDISESDAPARVRLGSKNTSACKTVCCLA